DLGPFHHELATPFEVSQQASGELHFVHELATNTDQVPAAWRRPRFRLPFRERPFLRGFAEHRMAQFPSHGERLGERGRVATGRCEDLICPASLSEIACNPHKRNGSSGRTRTYNPPVNSRMLCH